MSELAAPVLRKPQILELTGLSDTTLWRQVRAGKFPSPIRLAERAVGWRSNEVQDWLTSRQAVVASAQPPAARMSRKAPTTVQRPKPAARRIKV